MPLGTIAYGNTRLLTIPRKRDANQAVAFLTVLGNVASISAHVNS